MRHVLTPHAERSVRELHELAQEIDDRFLDLASSEARQEWLVQQRGWPSDADIRSGTIALSADELMSILMKVRRFRDILATADVAWMAVSPAGEALNANA